MSDEEYNEMQMKEWLAGSHFWVEQNNTFVCKWCGVLTTTSLDMDAHLCRKNPAIIKLLQQYEKEDHSQGLPLS